jgi:hypothetical protein
MLREIVKEVVASESDLDIVEEDGDAALATIRSSGTCVVITQLEKPAHVSVRHLLGERQQVRVLALSTDGREGAVYELQPEERVLGEISPPTLLAAIRDPLLDHPAIDLARATETDSA